MPVSPDVRIMSFTPLIVAVRERTVWFAVVAQSSLDVLLCVCVQPMILALGLAARICA
jgi:hypothetical protein